MMIVYIVIFVKASGDIKDISFTLNVSRIDNSPLGKGLKTHPKKDLIDDIIHYLMPVEDLEEVGPGLTSYLDSHKPVLGFEESSLSRPKELGVDYEWYAVLRRAVGKNFISVNIFHTIPHQSYVPCSWVII